MYNESFDHFDNPYPEPPDAGMHLWDWWHDMDARYSRISDGVCLKIPPSEWLAWQSLTGHVVYSWEFAILAAMDHAYCAAVNEEIRIGRVMEEQAMKGSR